MGKVDELGGGGWQCKSWGRFKGIVIFASLLDSQFQLGKNDIVKMYRQSHCEGCLKMSDMFNSMQAWQGCFLTSHPNHSMFRSFDLNW